MFRATTQTQWLGFFFCVLAVLLIFVWVPLDVETGIVETVRRKLVVGDSLGPTVAGAVILLGGMICIWAEGGEDQQLNRDNMRWLLRLGSLLILGLLIMRYAGAPIVSLITDESYRALRNTPPYSYVGYVLGGTLMAAGLTCLARRRVTLGAILVGLLATLVIALLYDLPFDDLLLPPNGDV